MGVSITFKVPGKPFAKQRPRFSRARGVAYTPKQTVQFESVVQRLATMIFRAPIEGPVGVHIEATFEPAKSWSKKKTAEHLGQWHVQKPDTDNLQKAILDGLNRIAFRDDSQVAALSCHKHWGEVAETVVTITSPPGYEEGVD